MSGSMSMSPAGTQPGLIDSLDSFVDFTTYESLPLHSPSLSPNGANKGIFTRPQIKPEASTANSLLSTGHQLSGPSHQYELYKQQTGLVPGALATTFAVNQNNHLHGFAPYQTFDYLGMGNTDEFFDFNTVPDMTSPELDNMEFDSPSSDPFLFDTVDPNSIGGQEPGVTSPQPFTSNVGRLYPGAHQQAALAKQQQQQQQQRQRAAQAQAQAQQSKQPSKSKSPQASDPLVEQKITQLLNSMRAKSASDSPAQPVINAPRLKKDEEDMDEDERLLASEEGKKLSSKERRQLRNKVSARAFRSRRKEYITQLEAEIANKVTENSDLRTQNRALTDENKRLSDLTRMLLSSPAFSTFLDQMSANPNAVAQSSQSQPQQPQQQEQQRQVPKDVNPYAAQQQLQQQQIGLAMIPEQSVDFSMLNMDNTADGFNYQPQVFAVLETPEPILDASVLSGKSSISYLDEPSTSLDEKVELPVIEAPPPAFLEEKKQEPAPPINEEFENNPAFALYHDSPSAPAQSTTMTPPAELNTEAFTQVDIFGGIEPEKAFARYELVDATEEEASVNLALARINRINASLEGVATRLELLTIDL